MPSKQAVWRAMNSNHADRLVEIATEHVRLANEAVKLRHSIDADIISTRINLLRKERDEILELYEEDADDHTS